MATNKIGGGHKLGNARRLQRKQARLEIVAPLYKKGYNYPEIRREVMSRLELETYSTSTLHKDIQTLLQEWREERIDDTDQLLTVELLRIDTACKELWEQWELSKQDKSKQTQKQTGIPTGSGGENGGVATLKLENSKITETTLGDPRYIAEIRAQLVERRKLLGLYAPNKTELTGKDGEPLVPTTYIFGNAEFVDTFEKRNEEHPVWKGSFTKSNNDSTNKEDTKDTEEITE